MALPLIGWLDDIVKDAFRNVFKGINETSDEYIKSLDLFKKGRVKYFDFIKDRYGKVQILGMTRPAALADVFVSVKVNQQIETKRYLDSGALQKNEKAYLKKILKDRAQSSENPIEAFAKLNRITLLGKPGCGKTTLRQLKNPRKPTRMGTDTLLNSFLVANASRLSPKLPFKVAKKEKKLIFAPFLHKSPHCIAKKALKAECGNQVVRLILR
jgi:predicted NACHT family NTPase